MLKLSTRLRLGVLCALFALMAVTGLSHFGSTHLLPDASVAIFVLGGLLVRRASGFVALMLAVFGLDIHAAETATQADWHLTPAYKGLVPIY